jgi:RNA recognition motif-containing protein
MNSMDFCKVFVGNVPFDCDNEEFSDKFKDIDGYIKAEIVTKNTTGTICSRGFGFVTVGNSDDTNCSSEDNAEKLLKRTDIDIRGRTLRFTEYISNSKKMDKPKNNYIVLEKIPKSISRKDIYDHLSSITSIGKCFIQSNRETGERKEIAIIEVLDSNVYNNIIESGYVTIVDKSDKHIISATAYRTTTYKKYDKKPSKLDLYKAFSAGRNMGLIEGMRMAKNHNSTNFDLQN